MMDARVLQTPVLILGSGVAGLSVALHLEGHSAILLSKTGFASGGSTVLAQGGIAAAVGEDDSPILHTQDTVAAGAGLSLREIARLVSSDAPHRIRELLDLGADFDRSSSGGLALGREGAHSRRRIVRAHGDASGAELARVLGRAVHEKAGIQHLDRVFAQDLILEQGRVIGVYGLDEENRPLIILAGATVLATGGIGQLWSHSSNPREATGDGLAMAIRAGARCSGLEFMQFHPTGLWNSRPGPLPLLSEALRGEGAHIIDEMGRRFLLSLDPRAELASRDIVARAIFRHQSDGHQVFLDLSPLGPSLETRFPTISAFCHDEGLKPEIDPLPITPLAHYHMGGVWTDADGRSSLQGLYACGEVASTGLHGANRLASNSLLEGLVFGARIGDRLSKDLPRLPISTLPSFPEELLRARSVKDENESTLHCLQETMWQRVGLLRSETGLLRALDEIRSLGDHTKGPGELANMLTIAGMICRAALLRRESLGAHFRSDYPPLKPLFRALPHIATQGELR